MRDSFISYFISFFLRSCSRCRSLFFLWFHIIFRFILITFIYILSHDALLPLYFCSWAFPACSIFRCFWFSFSEALLKHQWGVLKITCWLFDAAYAWTPSFFTRHLRQDYDLTGCFSLFVFLFSSDVFEWHFPSKFLLFGFHSCASFFLACCLPSLSLFIAFTSIYMIDITFFHF